MFSTYLSVYVLYMSILVIQLTTARDWNRFFHALPRSLHNPDTNRDIHQLIQSRGFMSEPHFVRTADGYILQLVRILNPYWENKTDLKPILLHHGFQCSGTFWLVTRNGTLLPDGQYKEFKSDQEEEQEKPIEINDQRNAVQDTLAFVLAAKGYDVWLANYRGSIYSINHTNLSTESAEFWSFSMDEMILFDIPALIDYVLLKSGSNNLAYLGHSQGNLMMFCLMSLSNHYARLIKPFIAISPVFYNSNVKGALLRLIPLINYLRSYPSMVPYSAETRSLFANMCENILTRRLCYFALHRFTGAELKNFDWHRLTVYMAHLQMGSSSWNAAQLLQLYSRSDGQPSAFDLGSAKENINRYAQSKPPIYDASRINCTDIALIYSQNDWLNPLENIEKLKQNLRYKPVDDYQVPDSSYGHLELVWAKNVGRMVNWKVLDILSRYD